MRSILGYTLMVLALLAFLAASGAFYTVQETEIVVVTQFGQAVGEPITKAGLHFKLPFVQEVNRLEKRVLEWDAPATTMPTKDKLYISVETFARWRIADPLKYFGSLGVERRALSRMQDIIGSETLNTVARHQLVEMIRTTKDRKPVQDDAVAGPGGTSAPITFPPIQYGREVLEKEILTKAGETLAADGINLLDVRFKRINYNRDVAAKIFDRMISERRQIADRYRSEGAGEAAKILGTRERDIREIESDAYRQALTIQGKADAEATAIYADAFNQNDVAREFYRFTQTLETYKAALAEHTTLILSADDPFFRGLKGDTLGETPGLAGSAPTKASPPPAPVAKRAVEAPAAAPAPAPAIAKPTEEKPAANAPASPSEPPSTKPGQ